MKRISKPTLYLRSAYFIESLKIRSGLRATELESRIRVNQYERLGFFAPSEDTVRDYFRLHRSVAFEPNQNSKNFPWLLAAELEFPDCSMAFFHPIFDLLFGRLESSAFWDVHFNKIPEEWIKEALDRGWSEMAQEWDLMNQAREKRLHRAKKTTQNNHLNFIHQSMLRITNIRELLFSQQLNGQYIRLYADMSDELNTFSELPPIEHITAILLCAKEAELIGNHARFQLAKNDLIKHLPLIGIYTPSQRIEPELTKHILEFIDGMIVPKYSIKFVHGFSMPASWRSIHDEHSLNQIKNEFIRKYLGTEK